MPSLAISSLICLWCLGAGLLLCGGGERLRTRLFPEMTAGVAVLYALGLSGLRLDVLATLLALSLPALLFRLRGAFGAIDTTLLRRFALLFALSLPVVLGMLYLPIASWDARSIWFFHAKILHYAGSLRGDIAFADPTSPVPWAAYPKLLSSLAAVSAAFAGSWNEFLPKAGLPTLLVLSLFGLAEVRTLTLSAKCLLLALFFLEPVYLTGGYADHWIAIFSCLGLLFLIDAAPDPRDRAGLGPSLPALEAAGAALFLLPMLKNEGKALALCLIVAAALAGWRVRDMMGLLRRRFLVLGGASFLAVGLWECFKLRKGLDTAAVLDLTSKAALGRFFGRLQPEIFTVLWNFLLLKSGLLALGLLAFLTLITGRGLARCLDLPAPFPNTMKSQAFLLPAVFAFLYICILGHVYLFSTIEPIWYLASSTDRTTMPLRLAVALPVLIWWSHFERGLRGSLPQTGEAEGQ